MKKQLPYIRTKSGRIAGCGMIEGNYSGNYDNYHDRKQLVHLPSDTVNPASMAGPVITYNIKDDPDGSKAREANKRTGK